MRHFTGARPSGRLAVSRALPRPMTSTVSASRLTARERTARCTAQRPRGAFRVPTLPSRGAGSECAAWPRILHGAGRPACVACPVLFPRHACLRCTFLTTLHLARYPSAFAASAWQRLPLLFSQPSSSPCSSDDSGRTGAETELEGLEGMTVQTLVTCTFHMGPALSRAGSHDTLHMAQRCRD